MCCARGLIDFHDGGVIDSHNDHVINSHDDHSARYVNA